MTQDYLDDVLVSLLSILFEFGFDRISNIFAERVEIVGRVLLFGYEFIFEYGFDDLSGF